MPSEWVNGNPKEGKVLYPGLDKACRLRGGAGFAPA